VSDTKCDISGSGDIYVYDMETDNLLNITHDLSVIRSLITPASWSPDSKWLVLYGAFSEQKNESGYIIPDWGSSIISRDSLKFFEIAPNYNTCRLSWAPNMRWLVSDTACFESSGTGSGLIAIPFDLSTLMGSGLRIDEIVSPLRFDWRSESTWYSDYSSPIWVDSNTFVVHRRITPMSRGYLSDEMIDDLASVSFVEINLTDYSETTLEIGNFDGYSYRFGEWFVTQDIETREAIAYNPRTNTHFPIPASISSCPFSHALKIEDQGDFIAVLNACESPEATPTVDIYEIANFTLIKRITSQDKEMIRPLGFFTSDTK